MKSVWVVVSTVVLSIVVGTGGAQHSHVAKYTGQQTRTIKSLSPDDIAELNVAAGGGWRRPPNSTVYPALYICWK